VTDALEPGIVARIVALCEADPGREVCGFVLRRGEALHLEHIPNVADRYHAVDPVRFPRTSRDSYLMDAKTQLRVHRELEAQGGEIAVVWHSHVETGAYFSDKDRADAVVDGQPTVPGAGYLVLGVRGGRVAEIRLFRWDGREFVEAPMAT
jgi:[CysO sulfur-carrier protein]-S-L-cysteine hydrolase